MRALLQRVTSASVRIDGQTVGRIGPGLVVLLGITHDDDADAARYLVDKTVNLRIFADAEGRFNHSLTDVAGELLIISQFTLYADTRRGRRPDFTPAAAPDHARRLYDLTVSMFQETGLTVATGEFQAYMQIQLENDGPVTLLLDSADRNRSRRSSVAD